MKKQVEIKVYGRVQGIGFRASCRFFARKLGLLGYVKNLEDGSVLIVAEGEKEDLEKLIRWAKEEPFLAKVEKIDIRFKEPEEIFEDFEIRF